MATDNELNNAKNVLRKDYWDSVRSHADNIVKEILAGEISDRDELIERIDQDADSSYWATYTHAALQCILATDNDATFEDNAVEIDHLVQERGVNGLYSVIAYYAFRQDLIDLISAADGVNIDNPGQAECNDCGTETDRSDLKDGKCEDCRKPVE